MAEPPSNSSDNPDLPEYGEDGVDLSVIRWTLSMTPRERLEFLDERISEIQAIRARNAGR